MDQRRHKTAAKCHVVTVWYIEIRWNTMPVNIMRLNVYHAVGLLR
jgi:hypothetical protein|eukprot:COSAG06_NODE_1265_length_10064_cov_8.150828_2_plen_45_part_00